MNTDRDLTRVIRSWLSEDAHEDADRVLNHVLDRLDATPQRRAGWLAWRFPLMNKTLRTALIAAAIVLAVVIGFEFLVGPNVGGPGPSPSPSVTPTPAAAFPPMGALETGRHLMTRSSVQFSLSVPTSGWSSSDGTYWISRDVGVTPAGAALLFWDPDPVNVYADPCTKTPLSPPAGSSASDLAAAMSAVPGTDLVSGPSDVRVGGRPAKLVVLTIREDIGCTPGDFFLWYFDRETARYATALGDTIRVWIVDVGGVRVVIEGETYKGAQPEAGQEIQQIIDSIRFG